MTWAASSLLWIVLLQAQPPAVGARGGVGLAVVSGSVVLADASEPQVSATVTLRPLDDAAVAANVGRGGSNRLQSKLDSLGRFSFAIPPGRYAVTTEREGYVREERFQYGLNQPLQSVLTVVSGKRLDTLIVTMNPAPSISGVVYGPEGQRIAAATVQAYRVNYTPYGRQLTPAARVLSHEGGEYRLFGLNPGSYFVSASISTQTLQSWKSVVTFTPNLPDAGEGYTTAYYPDETSIAHAGLINLISGRSVSKTDIIFRNIPNYRVTVRLTPLTNGQPLVNPNVALLPPGVDLSAASSYRMGRSGTNFTMNHVVEGDYFIVATADYPNSSGDFTTTIVSAPRTVQVSDNTEISLNTVEALDIAGRVILESGSLAIARNSSDMKVQLMRADHYSSESNIADLMPGGNFVFSNVGPGIYDVFLQGFPVGLFISDARLAVADRQLDHLRIDANEPPRALNAQSLQWQSGAPLAITVSASGGKAEGIVADGAKGFGGAEVVLVPVLETSRQRKDRYFDVASDESGKFEISGIPPGPYSAFAFQKIEPNIYFDSAFLDQVLTRGSSVQIQGGNSETLRLNIITTEELAKLVR